MNHDFTEADLSEFERTAFDRDRPFDEVRAHADEIVEWVQRATFAADQQPGQYWLAVVAEGLIVRQEFDRAQEVIALIEQDPDPVDFSCATRLRVTLAAEQGDVAGVIELADEARRTRAWDPNLAQYLGELFETIEDLPRAERWFTLGLRRDESEELEDFHYRQLLMGRYRVRRATDKPLDGFDLDAEDELQSTPEIEAALGRYEA